jgi:hypothetical protein
VVLSGSLREFILADVFQLLTQQKITGKLLLNNNVDEGAILFKDGAIVSAYKDTEKFENKLESYLIDIKKANPADCKSLFAAYKDNIAGLTKEVLSHSMMTEAEIATLAEITVEDITCSLFLWHKGSYRFSTIRSVDRFIPAKISIPIENIVMEAMRRVDEWNRMQEHITDEVIFINTDKRQTTDNLNLDPINDPVEYISRKINGTSSVKELIASTPLSHYKIYESLNTLIQSNKILPLSDKLSKSVQAAIERKNKVVDTVVVSVTLSSVITGIVIVTQLILSAGIFKHVLFSRVVTSQNAVRIEAVSSVLHEKMQVARLLLQSQQRFNAAASPDSLIELKLMNRNDIKKLGVNPENDQP